MANKLVQASPRGHLYQQEMDTYKEIYDLDPNDPRLAECARRVGIAYSSMMASLEDLDNGVE